MESSLYLLDANTFMTPARTYYSFKFTTSYWDFLLSKAEEGAICSIDKVFIEIKKGNDELKLWAESQFEDYFISTNTPEIISNYGKIVLWVHNEDQYSQTAKDEFMEADNADAWLLATALTKNLFIVTFEQFNPDIKRKIPIPNVCHAFNIQYCNLFNMLEELEFSF